MPEIFQKNIKSILRDIQVELTDEFDQNLVEADCDTIRDMVNNQLLPRMIRHGFPIQGIHFEWDYSTDYTPEQQVAYETMVLNEYEVDPAYFEEKYNIPVGERRTVPSVALPTQPQQEEQQKQPNNSRPFFD